ncbi:PREDICTED: ras-related protein Rab-33B [Chaetura pelagica]|uniref:ras-related protein Rab-33B n=1 Tax=Chaetura pelagica TaxID=8897 RepID=UPI0005231F4C|nr:PREDICTED: ras-related protein Rab-33B [Chaetura pelagica]
MALPSQYGFTEEKSCLTSLAAFHEAITGRTDDCRAVGAFTSISVRRVTLPQPLAAGLGRARWGARPGGAGNRLKGAIQLWDTAGQERFRKSMVQHYYRNVHAVVFVYDMTNIASFHSLPSWIEECKQHLLANDIPRILVGNKCDLRSAIQVPTDLAQKFADTHSMPLFETSAKNPNDNDHVEAIFMTLAHKLKSHKPLMLSQPPDRDEIHIKPESKPAMTCWC